MEVRSVVALSFCLAACGQSSADAVDAGSDVGFDAPPAQEWVRVVASREIEPFLIVGDGAGDIHLSGDLRGKADFAGTALAARDLGKQGYLASYDRYGRRRFVQLLDEGGCSSVHSLVLAPDGDLVVAGRAGPSPTEGSCLPTGGGEVFIARFDHDGRRRWSRHFDTHELNPVVVATTRSNGVLLLTHFYDSADFGGGALSAPKEYGLALVSLSPAGEHVWSRSYPPYEAYALAVGPEDRIAMGGAIQGSFDFGLGSKTTANSIPIVVQLSASGVPSAQWTVDADPADGSTSRGVVQALAFDDSNALYVGGSQEGALHLFEAGNGFVAKLVDGELSWTHGTNGPVLRVVLDDHDPYFTSCPVDCTERTMIFRHYDPKGALRGSRVLPLGAIAFDTNGHLLMSGWTQKLDLGVADRIDSPEMVTFLARTLPDF